MHDHGEASDPNLQLPPDLQRNLFITSVDYVYDLVRQTSVWPLMFGLACCAIEMICTAASRYDMGRFGMEVLRPSPRQADLLIVSGTVTKKMAPQIVRIFNQMAEPRYVLSMGACATGGGPFKDGYNVVSGIDKFLPVDVYVPGCPPTPEALIHGFLKLRERIGRQSITQVSWYRKGPQDAIPLPILGPDIFDPRKVQEIVAARATMAEAQPATPAEPVAGKKMSPEEIEQRRQEALARRAEIQRRQSSGTENP
jgi:NADH-quinone oxidoreductase subunit B